MLFYYINPALELVAFIISFFCLRSSKAGWYKHFIWFLLLVVITENTGFFLYFHFHMLNHWVYNLYLPVEIAFKSWLFYKVCKPYFNCKKIVVASLLIFYSVYVIEGWPHHYLKYNSITNSVFSVWLIVMCLLYFYYFLNDAEFVNIYQHPPFWIVIGLFFFYFVSTASNLFFDYISDLNKKSFRPFRYIIFLILDFLLYASWSYAFLCKRKEITST